MSTSDLSQKSTHTRRAGEFGHGPGRLDVKMRAVHLDAALAQK